MIRRCWPQEGRDGRIWVLGAYESRQTAGNSLARIDPSTRLPTEVFLEPSSRSPSCPRRRGSVSVLHDRDPRGRDWRTRSTAGVHARARA